MAEVITLQNGNRAERDLVHKFELTKQEMDKGFLRTRIVKNGNSAILEVFTLKSLKLTPEEKKARKEARQQKLAGLRLIKQTEKKKQREATRKLKTQIKEQTRKRLAEETKRIREETRKNLALQLQALKN